MKNKLKFKKYAFLTLIFILVSGLFITPAIANTATASSEEDSENNNSGGFFIESEKVDGQMDLAGSLLGKVRIKEGIIYGLTITKVLDTGKGQKPIVIRITSPGPVKVKNLYAETIGGAPPSVGGICKPSNVGWVCLTDVVMKVSEQSVSNISLPNTKIEVCYKSECGSLPDYDPMTKEELEELLIKKEERQSMRNQLKDKLESEKDKLALAEDILNKARKTYEKVNGGLQLDELENLTGEIRDLIEEDITDGVTDRLDKLVSLTGKLEKESEAFGMVSGTYTELVDQAFQLVEDLDDNLKAIEGEITKLTENNLAESEEKQEQVKIAAALLESAKGNTDQQEKISIDTIQKNVDNLKKETKEVKEKVNSLKAKEKTIQEKTKTLTDNMNNLKTTIKGTVTNEVQEKSGLSSSEDDQTIDGAEISNTETRSEAELATKPETESETKSETELETEGKLERESVTEVEDVPVTDSGADTGSNAEASEEDSPENSESNNSDDEDSTELEDVIDTIFKLF
ncbi:hypothetical protein NC797_14710 [Aquibacillus sp. 3ASR75-11]|uniref:Uncharacterized protein n=1 Tax=Terrihalobacillus insolitus TaxID=2950438 RepID=A0A9X4AMV7_9BACI|nr:hypothetical protein [Terrihalobacillus insolitus]MDC3425756.1 hypothetical protein [Terrihalobacillus insolitus]